MSRMVGYYIGEKVRSCRIRIKEQMKDIKYERCRTAFSRVNYWEDIVVLSNEEKIFYQSRLKLRKLIG